MFVKCQCNTCNGHIEFDADRAGERVTCPHCGLDTLLYCPLTPQVAPKSVETIAPEHSRHDNLPPDWMEEMPPLTPCKVCGNDVATLSEFCVYCGQAWPSLLWLCPKCGQSDFDIEVDESAPPLVLVPVGFAGFLAYVAGSLFQSAVEKAMPAERFFRCRVCGNEFLPNNRMGQQFIRYLK